MRLGLMTRGQLAQKTGAKPTAIPPYEEVGLIQAPMRSAANYRVFDSNTAYRIRFISKYRSLGFSIPEIADLLKILYDPDHTFAQVANLAQHHLDLIDCKVKTLVCMRRLATTLLQFTRKCIPECPVLEFPQKSA